MMGFFSLPSLPDRLWGPASFLSNEYEEALSPGVIGPGLEAEH
jgi:hypothetical protein